MSIKWLWLVGTSAVATFCLLVQFPGDRASAEDVNVAISSVGLYEIPLEISKQKGFYKNEGLNVRTIVVKTGLQATAMAAGELDYSSVGGATIRAAAKGLPVKVVMGWWDRPLHILVAKPSIKNVKELKNKRVAISSIGSTPYVMVREALAAEGMDPDHDVIFMSIGGSSARLAALESGTVDASPLDVAFIEKTDKLGLNNILYFGDVVNLPLGGLAVSVNKIKNNPEQIKRMIRATLRGLRFFKSNKEETLEIMKHHLKISERYVGKVYDFAVRSVNEKGDVGKRSLANELRLDKQTLGLKRDIPEGQVADWSFVRAIASSK
ncbi:MAG TPA: ABC transporter substrate-binding protein [Terriglobales bacterium]|nr:ABC transporter substrate-binding protein [Terriglobales bacterium]